MSNKFREYIKEHKDVQSNHLQFIVQTDMQIEDTGEKGLKVHLKARAKEPVDHPMFGRVVHDFGSMSVNKKIAIDFEHDTNIGYAKNFSITNYGLEIDGLIFKNTENPQHPANEVIYNLKNSIPLQVSIDFRSTYNIEEVAPDEKVMVNGILFSDGLIIRDWTLKKVAICSLGQDANTETIAQFSQSEILNPTNIKELTDKFMTNEVNEQKTEDISKTDETVITEEIANKALPDTEVVSEKLSVAEPEVKVDEVKPVDVKVEQESNSQSHGNATVNSEAVVETPKVEDPIVIELKSRIAELESQLESTKSAEKMHLQTIDELVKTHKKVAESFGAEPIQNSFENVKEFKNWQECVATIMTQYGLDDSDAHCKAIKLYPEFHKKQISKFNL